MESLPFAGGAYSGRSVDVNPQVCINFYTEADPASGRAEHYLVGTPGTKKVAEVGEGPIRAIHKFGPDLIVVSREEVFRGNLDDGFEKVGELDTIFGPVDVVDNGYETGKQVLISDTFELYLISRSVLEPEEDEDDEDDDNESENGDDDNGDDEEEEEEEFKPFKKLELGDRISSIEFQDGYFIVGIRDTNRFRISALYDGDSWSALDIASKEGSPDNLVSIISQERQLWLLGEKTSEAFYNSGNPDFPFERFQGGFLETGCVAPRTAAKTTKGVFWLSQDSRGHCRVVTVGEGMTAEPVSPTSINYQIQQYGRVNDAFAFVYQIEGHEFYVLTFPQANVTWVFDLTDGFWHQWSVWRDSRHNRHLSNDYEFYGSKHLVGHFRKPEIYEISSKHFTDDGNPIVRDRIFPHVNDSEKRLSMSGIQMVFEHGVGAKFGQGDPPQVSLAWSKDGGHNWSSFVKRDIGKRGAHSNRAIWKKLGQARRWTFWIRMSDPVKPIILDMVALFRGQEHV